MMIAFAIKSLGIAVLMSAIGFLLVRQAAGGPELKSRLPVWLAAFIATLACGFLSPGFWPGMLLLSVIALAFGRAEPLAPAAYLVLLFCLPPMGKEIPGIGGINYFFSLSPPLLLAFVLLAPFAALSGRRPARLGLAAPLLWVFMLACIVLEARGRSITDAVRAAFMILALILPIHLAFVRGASDLEGARRIALAFVASIAALCAIGLFETLAGYRLFGAMTQQWDMALLSPYSYRQGFLRAAGSVYDPIAFGAFAGLALILLPFALGGHVRNLAGYALIALFCAGLVASLSRGPWVATAAAILVTAIAAPRLGPVLARLAAAGLAGLVLLAATPLGELIVDLLPFIGDPADATIRYRQDLAAAGWRVASKHLWFGTPDYLFDPELQALRQGQGIIDLVNRYVELLLRYGLVGLGLFALLNALALWAAWRAAAASRKILPDHNLACRSMLAGLFLMLLLFATTSATQQLNQMHWVMFSATLAVAGMTRAALAAKKRPASAAAPAASMAPSPPPPPPASPPGPDPALLPAHLRQYVRRPE